MPVQLNHTIVRVRQAGVSTFLAELLGVAPPTPFGPFLVVQVDNDVSLDFADDHGPVHPQHYAFLVGEDEFDQIFGRIRERSCPSGPTRAGAGRVRSTPTTAAAASTGRTRAATSWRSSPARTAAAADPAGRCSLGGSRQLQGDRNGPAGTVRVRLPQPAPRRPPQGLLPGPRRPRCSRPCARSRVGGC